MLDLDLLLKRNELCVVGRAPHHANLEESGLYVRDTRFLSRFTITFKDRELHLLDLQVPEPDHAVITRTNPHLELGIDPQTLLVRQQVTLDTALVANLTVQNFSQIDLDGVLRVEVEADFRDMFDIRGVTPKKRAELMVAEPTKDGVVLAARSADEQVISTTITSSEPVKVRPMPTSGGTSGAELAWDVDLPRNAIAKIELRIQPNPVGAPLHNPSTVEKSSSFTPRLKVETPSGPYTAFLAQCDADLALLQTTFPAGNIPAAGIPWFIAPFGRDSLIVALQTMHAYPDRVAATLRVLAELQATENDPWREAQPGKILHEMRYGDMARTGQVPHTPYYGSVDSTPLFVMTFAQHYLWHRDDALYDELIGNARRALEWIEGPGDLDEDGFIEFSGVQQDVSHISQQGWKDSHDSLHFADGSNVDGPIALVEVQGYVYAAYQWLAQAAQLRGDDTWASELQANADRVRDQVEAQFWMEDAGYYAQALDGHKSQVDAISSNPGHLLFCGLPSPERAGRVAARMASPELNSGWGLRTLSTEMATYNPMSYHNGSIWPHDFSLAMAGLRDYGQDALASELAMGLLALASTAPDLRIAELYCGFPHMPDVPAPVAYPVSCIPQAWAAGAGLLALRTLLGLRPDVVAQELVVSPHLPNDWSSLSASGLHAYGSLTSVQVRRDGDGYSTTVTPE